jgi:hypothetical protein
MANNNNNANRNAYGDPAEARDWLSLTKAELRDENAPLGMIRDKPLSYFDALTRNFCGEPNLFQVNLGQFPQNFLVTTGRTLGKSQDPPQPVQREHKSRS